MKRILPVAFFVLTSTCSPKPTPGPAPTPPTPTRIITVSGDLGFGDVNVGQESSTRTFRIQNSGNATLTISGMTGPSGLKSSWTSGTIAAGVFQDVTMTVTPPSAVQVNSTVTVNGDHTSGTNTIGVAWRGVSTTPPPPPPPPSGPRTQFGAGQWRVNSDIAPGRYFTNPMNGCYWERQRGFSGNTGDIIANDFVSFSASQYIVDIKDSDLGFETDTACRTWFNTPRVGGQGGSIPPGIFLVGSQIAAGTYRTNAQAGCYWERLRDFEHILNSINANHFQASAGQILVTISAGDAGFHNDGDCGTWAPASNDTALEPILQSRTEIEQHWRSWRAQKPIRR